MQSNSLAIKKLLLLLVYVRMYLDAVIYLTTMDVTEIEEGESFSLCANFQSPTLERNVEVKFSIQTGFRSKLSPDACLFRAYTYKLGQQEHVP